MRFKRGMVAGWGGNRMMEVSMVERLGRYELDAVIAEGGMARIYRAHSVGLGGLEKGVALKRLRGQHSQDDEVLRMMVDEARLMALMSQKNICQVYGLESDGGEYFVVMEHVDGCDLSVLCRTMKQMGRRLPEEAALYIVIEALSGLSYAHRLVDAEGRLMNVVHRDVNPQNILLSREGEVKLIDFGIAKATLQSTKTQAGTIKGKINYMSPEQARGDRIDQATDVFAMGAVLYEILSGEMLYPLGLDDLGLMRAVKMAQYRPIEEHGVSLHPVLHQILTKALARDKFQRFLSSRDFLLALTQYFHEYSRRFDAMQLSMLVEDCVGFRGDGAFRDSGQALGAIKLAESPASDGGGAEILNAVGGGRASAEFFEESPTSVYDKRDMQGIVQSLEAQYGRQQGIANAAQSVGGVGESVAHTKLTQIGGGFGSDLWSKLRAAVLLPLKHPILSLLIALTLCVIVLIVVIVREDSGAVGAEQILLRSQPEGAQIYKDGVNTRLLTPTMIGTGRSVVLKKAYFRDAHVDLQGKDLPSSLDVVLTPQAGKLIITSSPAGAQIKLNGEIIGQTPHTIDAAKGQEYEVFLTKPDYRTERRAIFWSDEALDDLYVDVDLTRD